MSDYDELTVIRLQQENDRLRAENAVLRPLVSDLQHRLRMAERHMTPQDIAKAETEPLIRKNRDHG